MIFLSGCDVDICDDIGWLFVALATRSAQRLQ
jgi:hypothetical protein